MQNVFAFKYVFIYVCLYVNVYVCEHGCEMSHRNPHTANYKDQTPQIDNTTTMKTKI